MADMYGDLVFIDDGSLYQDGEALILEMRKVATQEELNSLEPVQVYGNAGVVAGGDGDGSSSLEWFNFATKDQVSEFGNLTNISGPMTGTSNGLSNRGIFAIGSNIDQISMNFKCDSVEWGELILDLENMSAHSNGVNDRGIIAGGNSQIYYNVIQYKTISTNSNAVDFGDLLREEKQFSSTSSGINDRGIFAGGLANTAVGITNQISYITISTLCDAQDFGDLTTRRSTFAITSNGQLNRAVTVGGLDSDDNNLRIMQYFDISTLSDAIHFGSLYSYQSYSDATSNGKGSLGVVSGGNNTLGETSVESFNIRVPNCRSATFGTLNYGRQGHAAISNGDSYTTMMTVPPLSNGELITVLEPLSLFVCRLISNDERTEEVYTSVFFEVSNHENIFYEYERSFFIGGITNEDICDKIDMLDVGTLSDAVYFSTLSMERYDSASVSNSILDRAVTGGGWNTNDLDTIEYFKMTCGSSLGVAQEFGNLTFDRRGLGAVSNGKYDRGVFISGYPTYETMDYITISTTGDALSFGDLIEDRGSPACDSNLIGDRGVIAGGEPDFKNIEYITISTLCNGALFGNLDTQRFGMASCNNSILNRVVFSGGQTEVYVARTNIIEYIDIMFTSDATDFGDLLNFVRYAAGSSNGVNDRGVVAGGDYFTDYIQCLGILRNNTVEEFGDLAYARHHHASTSNSQ